MTLNHVLTHSSVTPQPEAVSTGQACRPAAPVFSAQCPAAVSRTRETEAEAPKAATGAVSRRRTTEAALGSREAEVRSYEAASERRDPARRRRGAQEAALPHREARSSEAEMGASEAAPGVGCWSADQHRIVSKG
ncbi:hypothetical protein U9M48_023959 [Paspalum notatum var. saurae]|uniref:Uncharacterized protein n=1 Tax=Paspalum notatum var. saurae TaxID=547442 RepID=A0AAQ3TRU2_PASNO